MIKIASLILMAVMLFPQIVTAETQFETDTIPTRDGDLKITFIGHGSLILAYRGKIIHVDPYGRLTDYGKLPKADLVLITHDHSDHLDLDALGKIQKPTTKKLFSEICASKLKDGVILKNGDVKVIDDMRIEAVPAYNMVHMRTPGVPYHPKGVGNGYIIDFGDKRVYVAGDTEDTPEMKNLKDIDVAFLPMNLPYTMTPDMVADAAKAFKPRILYPYHTGDTDLSKLVKLMKGTPDIDLRLRKMK
jgi:L-ascorbate metabolism protein UlaG (beta-lactamase superfamily)